MKNVIRCMAVLALCSTSPVWASGVVHVADGDCAALAAAANSSPGSEPPLIVLARNGHYLGCSLDIVGNVVIDGAGATLPAELLDGSGQPTGFLVHVEKGANLTLRNLNIEGSAHAAVTQNANVARPDIVSPLGYAFLIEGTLVLDSVSVASNTMDYLPMPLGYESGGLFHGGDITLRNTTVSGNVSQSGATPLFDGVSNMTISNSTIANNQATVFGSGNVFISNSIVSGNSRSCSAQVASSGGNVTDDANCALNGPKDRVVADAHLLELDRHGGVVKNLALRNDSPAIGNAVVSSCEGTDLRGFSRGQIACDSGAYEFGGDSGSLSESGMSGLYYNPGNDGHYVSIQRLHGDAALVIWNTFDENGVPAWLYGVGSVSGNSIHVDEVARNSGGKLLPGGGVVGSHASAWGSIDVNLHDCYDAQLSYNSSDPNFGTGSTPLTRLAFVDGVNCAP